MSAAVPGIGFFARREVRLLQQSEAAECGIACLGMVAGFHGHHVSLVELRRLFSVSMAGTTLADLVDFADRLGLAARALRLELDQVALLSRPAILHWDLNHFVVLAKVSRRGFLVFDPASGHRWISREELSARFTGVALELTPTRDFSVKAPGQALGLADFCANVVGLKRYLALVLCLSIVLQTLMIAGPYYMQLVVDDVLMTSDMQLLLVLALGFSMLLVFEVIAEGLRGLALLHLGSLMSLQMTVNLFHHLVRLPLAYFEKRHMGDIVSRFGSLSYVKDLLTKGLVEALIDGVMVVAVVVVLFIYSRLLASIVVVAAILYALVRLIMYRSLRDASMAEIMARANENTSFMETVRGIQTIKLFGAEAKREGLWRNLLTNATNKKLRLGVFNVSYRGINRLLFGVENIVVVYVAAKLVVAGGFSVGMLFAFIAYKTQFMGKFSSLVEKGIEFRMLSLHFDRVGDVALSKREDVGGGAAANHRVEGALELRNIAFRYAEAGRDLVSGLSLDIRPGEFVAIVGPSGYGKTTVMKLMLGLLDPTEGEVLVDGVPLRQVGLDRYRRQVAAVMQEDQLLSGSIVDNIAFFDEKVDMARTVSCARMAAMDEAIRAMPMGYNSLIGDMGSSLSGGQKQRLLLARALYRQPSILFLDEATSHLDARTEAGINVALRQLRITRVVIAHRSETIACADRVIDLSTIDIAARGRLVHEFAT
ncbi:MULTISPECIES: peptidase domain-containing ABC transporter [unclassified Luteimonas]